MIMKSINKNELFKRQTTLAELGEIGQEKLQNAGVLVVGCGGLGGSIAVQLAASGIGKIHLVDFDNIEVSNLHRQVFFSIEDVGEPKAEILAKFIEERAPFTEVSFSNKPITKENVFELINNVDIVVDGTDSLPTKYLLNDACVIKNKPLVYGSLYKFDGYIATFNVQQEDGSLSANLRDAFPNMATDVPNCEEAGTMNAIVSLIASLQVNEVLKLIIGIGKPLINQLLVINSLQNSQLKVKVPNKFSKKAIESIFKNETYSDPSCEIQNPDWLISAEELKKTLTSPPLARPILIGVLDGLKTSLPLEKIVMLSQLDNLEVDPSKKYVFVCQKGLTSYRAVQVLKQRYPEGILLSLEGGIANY